MGDERKLTREETDRLTAMEIVTAWCKGQGVNISYVQGRSLESIIGEAFERRRVMEKKAISDALFAHGVGVKNEGKE